MVIVVDAMGGDNAPEQIINGSIDARDEYNVGIILSGKESEIKKYLEKKTTNYNKIDIINAEDVITNDDKPVLALRRKKDSSLVKALNAVKNKDGDAIVSAGSTGALLAGGTLIIGRINGIERPALAPLIPSNNGMSLLLDSGANSDCKPEYLYNFAIMGSIYMQQVMNRKNPKVGLANIGTEKGKGNKLTIETYDLLEQSNLNFYGNIEVRDILKGYVDVVVTDGFTGNVILKTIEGTAAEIMSGIKAELLSSTRTKLGAMLVKPALKNFKKRFDYSEYGGAPLLGVNAPVIKAHGSSDAFAIKHAIRQSKLFIESSVNNLIEENILER